MNKKKILFVDDQEDIRYLLRVQLESQGFEVLCASNGLEALDLARSIPPDLVISDILMPVMDGFVFCREWNKDSQLKKIPFIFYSATYADEQDKKFALSLGAVRFIDKAKEPAGFALVIQEAIKNFGSDPAASVQRQDGAAKDELVYLKQYNEALIRKLESKMEQLVETNQRLEKEIRERKKLEEEDQKRIRELGVFYKASIGREERIMELKKKLDELEEKLKKS